MTDSHPDPRRTGFSLYPLWQWLVVVPVIVVTTMIGGILAALVATLISPRLANLYIAVPWCRLVAGITPMRVDVEGREHLPEQRACVVVANHQSQYDIPLIYGFCGLDLRWVMKAELGRVPFVAQGCRAIGHIFIDRSDPDQSRDAINRAVGALPDGTGVLFFAEGTRSRDGRLLPFKKGAFRVAVDKGLPVVPMTVTGTRDVLPSGSLKIRPGRARLIIHPAVETAGLTDADVRGLCNRVRDIIAAPLPQGAP